MSCMKRIYKNKTVSVHWSVTEHEERSWSPEEIAGQTRKKNESNSDATLFKRELVFFLSFTYNFACSCFEIDVERMSARCLEA